MSLGDTFSGAMRGGLGAAGRMVDQWLTTGASAGVAVAGAAALASLFKPDLGAFFTRIGKPQLWEYIAPRLDTSEGFLPMLLRNFGSGAVIGGVYGAGAGALQGMQEAQMPKEEVGAATYNTGATVGGLAAAGVAALLAAKGYEAYTGNELTMASLGLGSGKPAPTPGARAESVHRPSV